MSFNNPSFKSLSSWTGASTASRWRTPVLLGAAGMAAAFLYVQARKAQVERAHPPEGKFVEVDGVRLHYLEQGEGPAPDRIHGRTTTTQHTMIIDIVMDNAGRMHEFNGCPGGGGMLNIDTTTCQIREHQEARAYTFATCRENMAAGVTQNLNITVYHCIHRAFNSVERGGNACLFLRLRSCEGSS